MSKKDYIEIARILKEANQSLQAFSQRTTSGQMVVNDITRELCELFLKDNPNFDPERFRAAVFGTEEAKK
jgi:hypothetical protein